jgi:flagellar biosynthesis/type III secretory pathway chaperone
MASLLENLHNNLELQEEVFSALVKFAIDKKQAIIKNDIPLLQKYISEENEVIGKSIKLSKERDKLFKDIAFVLNVKKNTVSLSEIIELINSPEDKERLISSKKRLISLLNNLREVNNLNDELIKCSLEHIDYSMNLLRGYLSPEPTYFDYEGNEINSSSKMLFDTKQ